MFQVPFLVWGPLAQRANERHTACATPDVEVGGPTVDDGVGNEAVGSGSIVSLKRCFIALSSTKIETTFRSLHCPKHLW